LKTKTKITEQVRTPHKQRIREIIKKPKEKFLTKSQEDYWNILGNNQITLCFGPAGVGKSYSNEKSCGTFMARR
jgi:phosphate starvation-inducible protein PhoH